MKKDKICRNDDDFKARARAHQFAFRERVLHDFYEEKWPQVLLSPDSARRGLIFCEAYRDRILRKVGQFGTSAVFSNLLRSEHIPYNLFVPMEEDLENAGRLFNKITGAGISAVTRIDIEFAGYADRSLYLNDRTSFDAYIEYTDGAGRKGAVGIEVKYTENSYSLGAKEARDISDAAGPYARMTRQSGYFLPDLDVTTFLRAHRLRQMWRNHLLGYAMVRRGDIRQFHYLHLYPRGNVHFHRHALPEYRLLLSPAGQRSFVGLTYEDFFEMLRRYFTSDRQRAWVDYLYARYLDL